MTTHVALAPLAGSSRDACLGNAKKTLLWYLTHARRARVCYQTLEVFQIGTGAMIPLAAAVHWPIAVSAALGAAIAVAGGLRSAFRWQGLCPYTFDPPGGAKRRELTRAFCRYQRLNAQRVPWNPGVRTKHQREFWARMEALARW